MKFSILLVLALTFTTLASAESSSFQAENAKEAEKLTQEFAKLTPNSPCTNGQNACVQKQFAQCVGGKFQLTPCGTGTECTVLPLVNKAGTSVTCDTPADQKARIAAASGQNTSPAPPTGDNPPPSGNNTDPAAGKTKENKSKKNKKGGKNKNKGGNNGTSTVNPPPSGNNTESAAEKPKEDKSKKNNKGGKNKNKGGNNGTSTVNPPPSGNNTESAAEKPKEDKSKKNNKGGKNKEGNKGTSTPLANNEGNNGTSTPPRGTNIQQQNAAEAESLQSQFDKLTPDSSCTSGENACVNKQFAQCVNGKFALTPCGSGLECAALPLVLKQGTTVACTTEADRTARINSAKSAKK